MTNYESTVYTVEDEEQDTSAAFSTVPTKNDPTLNEAGAAVMKLWHSTTLPDGQPINVSVLFTLDDVRGLQAYLNDNFGRGVNRPTTGEALQFGDLLDDPIKPGDKVTVFPAQMQVNDGEPKQGYVVLPEQDGPCPRCGGEGCPACSAEPGWGTSRDGAATWNPIEAQRAAEALGGDAAAEQFLQGIGQAADAIQQMQRQCPVIYSGVQCQYPDDAEIHGQFGHSFVVPSADDISMFPQTGDGATAPAAVPTPTAVAPAEGLAAESATAVTAAEAPSPSDLQPLNEDRDGSALPVPAKKKVNRRKKEEKAYDDALEHFRANPQMQTAYTDLVKAAEALRKRFPDATRLVAYDLHVQHQDVGYLTGNTPVEQTPTTLGPEYSDGYALPGEQVGPSFAPEPAAQQRTPFVPPAAMPAPEQQSAEELQAAQAFPCQMRSSDGRQCTRPAGHELASPPKPHMYAVDLNRLGEQAATIGTGVQMSEPGFTVTPVGEGSGFTQATIPPFQIPQPTALAGGGPSAAEWADTPSAPPTTGQQVLSFQIPPTPEVQGAELQPPAPAAPPWSQS